MNDVFCCNIDGKQEFIKMDNMTCSYRDSIKSERLSEFFKFKSDCSRKKDCTGIRTNYCTRFVGDLEIHYEMCNDDPIPLRQVENTSQFERPTTCVHKKLDEFGKLFYDKRF